MLSIYIDREESLVFEHSVSQALNSPAASAVVFQVYGVGGVGKSTVLDRVEQANRDKAQLARVSFGDEDGLNEPISLMKKLYDRLEASSRTPGLLGKDVKLLLDKADPFPEQYRKFFDAKHELLKKAADGRGQVKPEDVALLRKWWSGGAKAAGQVVQAGTTAASVAGSGVPIPAGAVEKTAELAFEASMVMANELDRARQLIEQHAGLKKDRALKELLLNPEEKLTEAFVEGLKLRGKRKPVLLLLDTYEKAAGIDLWLRRLLLKTDLKADAVRWVIGGRYELGQQTADWQRLREQGVIQDQQLKQFEQEDTAEYLKQLGITDPEEVAKLHRQTQGLPFFLNELQRNVTLDISFAADRLLLGALTTEEVDVVQAIACCRWFDETVVEFLTSGREKRDWFNWLKQQYFVEQAPRGWRFKDVVRDVVRRQWFEQNRRAFQQVHESLALFFEEESGREVLPGEPISLCYDNEDWRRYREEMLYHAVYGAKPEVTDLLRSHLLEAWYLLQNRVVREPIAAVTAEGELGQHPLLSDALQRWLQRVMPVVEQGWVVLEKMPIEDSFNQELFNLSRQAVDNAWQACLERPEHLEGLAKFAALFLRSRRCLESQRVSWLEQAQQQAEEIATEADRDFSSGLFLWELGNSFEDLDEHEQAIASYDKSIEFKPDQHEAWYNRGNSLVHLGRYEDAIASYDQSIEFKFNKHEAWYSRGVSFDNLGRYEDAIAS